MRALRGPQVSEAIFGGSADRQCARKVLLPDADIALMAAKRMMRKVKGSQFNAYKCPHCNGWHIGRERSQQAADRRARRGKTK